MDKQISTAKRLELLIEWLIFSCRWLLVPFYLGLGLALIVLLAAFINEFFHFFSHLEAFSYKTTTIFILEAIDLTLIGSLMLMVMLAGYENFVSRIDIAENVERPEWMGKLDFSSLKLKLVSSLVAISSIQLLKAFLNIEQMSEFELHWMLLVHLTFVISGLLLALMDFISSRSGKQLLPAPGQTHASAGETKNFPR